MSHTYYPDPNSDTPRGQGARGVESSTNATPIEIEVTTHGWSTGDSVEIINADDPAADGQWNITVTGADTFTLDGSVGTQVGATQGFVKNFTVVPNSTMVDDGDAVDATNTNAPIENVTNFLPFMYRLGGQYRLFHMFTQAGVDAGRNGTNIYTSWSTTSLTPTGNQWVTLTSSTFSIDIAVTTPDYFAAEDLVEVVWSVAGYGTTTAVAIGIGLSWNGAADVILPGSAAMFATFAATNATSATLIGTAAGSPGTLSVTLMAFESAATQIDVVGDYYLIVRHWKPN